MNAPCSGYNTVHHDCIRTGPYCTALNYAVTLPHHRNVIVRSEPKAVTDNILLKVSSRDTRARLLFFK